tara:strand:+ start:1851 stop:2402 length:552 start_codon:yes stop_codon:yes gene_type:complete
MHLKNFIQYYFIDKFEYSHLIKINKNISFIWRNKDKESHTETLLKLSGFCQRNQRKLYISNDIKLAFRVKADGVYISSTNNDLNIKYFQLRNNFKILGSAHNLKEIRLKELQNVVEVFLSPLFKDKINKQLNVYRYLNLRKLTFIKDISLGGINNKNIKKLELIKPYGFAGISYFNKKKAPKN